MTEETQSTAEAFGDSLLAPVTVEAELHPVVCGSSQVGIAIATNERVLVVEYVHFLEEVGSLELYAVEEVYRLGPVIPSKIHVQFWRHRPAVLYKRGVSVGAAVVELFVYVVEVHLVVDVDVTAVLLVGVARGDGQAVLYAAVHTVVGVL